MKSLNSFPSVVELIKAETPEQPVICILPERLRKQVKLFADGFPGKVLYPVKTNHDNDVLKVLWQSGVRDFDTASIGEIRQVKGLFPDAKCYFNHPVKPVSAIREAYEKFGIADYVIDHVGEFEKLKLIVPPGRDIILQIRLAPHNPDAEIEFSEKFGAEENEAVELLKMADAAGYSVAVSFHTGWQTTNANAYNEAIKLATKVLDGAVVEPKYLNMGGGFPSHFKTVPLAQYFEAISASRQDMGAWSQVPFYCEPGSATVTYGQGVLIRVELRKDEALYFNDGIYGALAELPCLKTMPPHGAYSADGEINGPFKSFTAFGPTCDSGDVVPLKFELPATIKTGDWVYIENLGAYSNALITSFNGFDTHEKVFLTSS
jgi:ornithine decarboxylase